MSIFDMVEPDLSARPLQCAAERLCSLSPEEVIRAWTTEDFERWFASPGTLSMKAEVNAPFFFEAVFEGQRHPHYGRFLELKPDRLKFTWLNAAGTKGVETVVTIDITPLPGGTKLQLAHAGFPDEESRRRHEEAWPKVLEKLEQIISAAS